MEHSTVEFSLFSFFPVDSRRKPQWIVCEKEINRENRMKNIICFLVKCASNCVLIVQTIMSNVCLSHQMPAIIALLCSLSNYLRFSILLFFLFFIFIYSLWKFSFLYIYFGIFFHLNFETNKMKCKNRFSFRVQIKRWRMNKERKYDSKNWKKLFFFLLFASRWRKIGAKMSEKHFFFLFFLLLFHFLNKAERNELFWLLLLFPSVISLRLSLLRPIRYIHST